MEYLVTMTTLVPNGTPERDITDIRAREAAHTDELALQGRVLRLWRPPLQPGQWRTIGLFSATDAADLDQVLRSMPLRIWRTDDITDLRPHPNDPGAQQVTLDPDSTEFLTTLVLTVPPGTSAAAVKTVTVKEAGRARELATQQVLIRLWDLPGQGRILGHWQARDSNVMQTILQSLPITNWLSIDTLQLSRHPNDPATGGLGAHLQDAAGVPVRGPSVHSTGI